MPPEKRPEDYKEFKSITIISIETLMSKEGISFDEAVSRYRKTIEDNLGRDENLKAFEAEIEAYKKKKGI